MKTKILAVFKTAVALASALTLSLTAQAATATKAATGTDLTGATAGVWTGGSGANGSPTSADTATWPSGSLGAGLTLASSVSWGGISVTAALTDISITGAGVLTNAGGISASTSTVNVTFANPIALSASQTWNINAAKSLTISGIISGTAFGITKDSGTGTLNLANIANTFSGAVSVSAGTLQFGTLVNSQNYAYSGNALTINGGILSLPGTSSGTVTQNYNFANLTGTINVTSSTIAFSQSNNTTQNFNGALNFSGNNTFTHAASSFSGHTVAFTKQITGSGTLTFNTSGAATARNYTISGSTSNSYTGTVVLNTAAASSSFVLTTALGASSYEIRNGWILNNNIAGGLNNANAITLVSAASVLTLTQPWVNSSAALTLTNGTVNVGNANSSIGNLVALAGAIQGTGASSALTVNQTTDGTCAAVLTNTTGNTLSLTKTGAAKLTLSAANSYAGNTTISNGTLQVSGSLASANVIVITNATLGGTGTLLGSTTVNAGGTVSPGGNAPLTLNALTFGAAPTDALTLTLQGDGTTVAGYVAVIGSNSLTNNGSVTINVAGALPATTGTYNLLTYSGTVTGSGTFVVGSLTSGAIGYVTNNVGASAIQLVVTGTDYLRWVGSPTNNWDLSGGNVWRFGSSGLPASYSDTKRVVLDDTASNFVVNAAAPVAPGGIVVTNDANNYIIGGSGKITGGTGLTKDGAGTLTLTTTNDYTAQTVVNSGTLKLGDGTTSNGSVTSSISNNAALVFANPSSQTYAGVLSGPGTVTKQAAGALTVGGNNTYDGLTTISGGTLLAGSTTALGSTAAGTVVSSGTLDVNGKNLGAEAVSISGQGVGNNGAVVNSGAAQTSALQSLTLNANATVGGSSRWDVRGAGSVLNLNGLTLTKTGSNQVTVVQSTVADGSIVINQGELGFQVGASFPAGLGQIAVNSGGTLGVSDWGTPLAIFQPVTLNGGTILADAGGTTATLYSPVTLTTNSTISVSCPLTLTNVVSGAGLLTVSGTSSLIFDSPTNTWLGGLDIEGATVQLGNNDDNGVLPASVLVVTNNGMLAYSRATDLIFNQAMVGTGGLKQAGPNIITMTNQQTYTGATVLQSGTLLLAGGNNTLSPGTTLSFTGNATLNLQANAQTVYGITINNSITGTIIGTNVLNVVGSADLRLGSTGNTTPTLNLSGVNAFGYNQPTNTFSVGGQSAAASSSGAVNLAVTNTITAKQFGVADNGAYPGFTSAGTVKLGVNNTINANNVVVGYGNSANGGFAATGTLDYESGVSNPSLIIRNAGGTGRANVTIGYAAASDYSAGNGTVDLVTGVTGASTLDALVGSLIIGQHNVSNVNFSRSATGVFTMGNGTLDATSLVLGQKTYSGGKTTSSASGTFSVNGGTVKVNTMLIGDQLGNNGPSITGTFNLNSGTLMAGSVQAGAGTASRTINWNDGVITNYDASTDLAIGTNLTLTLNGGGTPTIGIGAGRLATVGAVLNGSSTTLTKTGNGTVILSAVNTCSGTTTINQGELLGVTGGSFPSTMALANTGVLGVAVPDNTLNWSCSGIICGSSSSKLDFNFVSMTPSSTVAPLQVNGDVDFTAATPGVSISGGLLIPLSTGNGYPLMTWTGTGPTSTNGMALTLSARETCHLSIVGNTLYLVVTSITPAQLVWSGANGAPWNSTVTNWLNGGSPDLYLPGDYVTFNDAAATFTVGISNNNVLPGGILFSNNTTAYTVTGTKAIAGGAGLTKAGSAALTLGTANTYTGNTVISAGKLILSNAVAIPGGAGNGNVIVNGTLDVAGFSPTLNNLSGSGTVDDVASAGSPVVSLYVTAPAIFSGVIKNTTGTLGLAKSGPDTLTLSGLNTYAGATTISGGTLSLAVNNNPLPVGTPLVFTSAGTLSVNGISQALTNVTVADSITGMVNGSGTLNLSGGQNLVVGNLAVGGTSALDLSGLAVFTFNGPTNNLVIGGQLNSAADSSAGTLNLATNSTLTANNLNLQTSTSGNGAANLQINTGTLNLGLNTTLNLNSILIGTGGRDAGYFQYAASINNPTLTIRAADGIGRATITMGAHTTVNGTTSVAALDLTSNVSGNSTLDALVGTLSVGNYSRGSGQTENASFLMGNGTLDATNINLGTMANNNGNNGALNSTFTLGGGTVKVGSLTMGNATASQGALTSVFNLNSGIVQAKTIQAGTATATRAFNWNDGVITNYDASTDLTIAGGLNLTLNGGSPVFGVGAGRTATVNAVLDGSTPTLTKTGNGTLVLGGANTYSADTAINAGAVFVNGSIPSGIVTVAANAVLGGAGTVGNVATVLPGGSVQGGGVTGSNTLTIATLNLGTNSISTTHSRFTVAAGGTVAATTLNVAGTNLVDILDPSLVLGTNTLITYSGTIGGNGFAGFKLGTLPSGVTANLIDTGSAVQLAVTALGAPPTVTVSPASTNVFALSPVTFTANVTGGTAPFTYQWYDNLTNAITGATNASLTLTNLAVIQSGNYTVAVTNGIGGTTAFGSLTVNALVPPSVTGRSMVGGAFQLTFNGPAGETFKVLSTTNIVTPRVNWTVLTNGTFTGSPVTFADFTVTNHPRQFYLITAP